MRLFKIITLLFVCTLIFNSCGSNDKEDIPQEYKGKKVNVSPSQESGQKKNRHGRSRNTGDATGYNGSSTNGRHTKYQLYTKHGWLVANKNDKAQFARYYAKTAQEEARKFGIPASVILAQAILESGADSYKAMTFNNFFGIKCKNGASYGEIDCKTDPNDAYGDTDKFAVYKSPWFSFRAHSKFLKERPYYKSCFDCKEDPFCWYEALEGTYCPEQDYSEGLTRIHQDYNLGQYDIKKADKFVNVSPSNLSKDVLPVSSYTWLFNPSHGSNTPGKRKTFSKKLNNGSKTIYEYMLNREVCNRVISRCNQLGINYKLVVSETKDIPLAERRKRANNLQKQIGNTILITFDHNATPFDNSNKNSIAEGYEWYDPNGNGEMVASGAEGFHHKNNKRMKYFLDKLGENINKRMPKWYSRGTKTAGFYMIRKTTMPSATLELGFFDNYKEANFLLSEEYQTKISEAIVETLCYFSGVKYVPNGVLSSNRN